MASLRDTVCKSAEEKLLRRSSPLLTRERNLSEEIFEEQAEKCSLELPQCILANIIKLRLKAALSLLHAIL